MKSTHLLVPEKMRSSLAPRLFAALLLAVVGSASALQVTTTKAFDYSPVTGLLIKEIVEPGTSHLCLVTEYTYDAFGNKKTQAQRNCNGSSNTFPGSTTVEAAAPSVNPIVPRVNARQVTYNSDGSVNVVATTAASTSALPQHQTSFFSPTGNLVRESGPNTLKNLGGTVVYSEWAYDGFGRKVLEKAPDGNGTRIAYGQCSVGVCEAVGAIVPAYVVTTTPVAAPIDLVAKTTGAPNGPSTKVYYDNLDRPIRRETQGSDVNGTSDLVYQDTRYDALGRVLATSLPYYGHGTQSPAWTNYLHDKLGRVRLIFAPGRSLTKTAYNGLVTSVTNSLSQTTTKTRNVAGDVVQVTDANNKTMTLAYDPLGNLLQSTDSLGNVTTMQYDVRKRRLALKDPDLGSWTYGYDALGNLKTQTDARAQVTTMSYDLMDRMVSRQEPSLNTSWVFDNCPQGVGKLCRSAAANGYQRNHSYDSLGRAAGVTVAVAGKSYTSSVTYDANGRTLVSRYPTGVELQNVYTPLGYLQKVVGAANGKIFWKVDAVEASGQITQQSYLNGFVTKNIYDYATERLLSTTTARASDNLTAQSLSFNFDQLGNLTSRIDFVSGLTSVYTYDSLNRLLTETRSGGGLNAPQLLAWTYDEIGNIRSRSDVGTYAYNPSGAGSVRPHAVTNIAGTASGETNPAYGYDQNGNLTATTAAGGSHTVTWNSFNMVDSVSRSFGGNTNKLDYLYGADRDRVREIHSKNGAVQRTTIYLNSILDNALFYEEENGVAGLKIKHYINAGGTTVGALVMDQTYQSAQHYWHKDHLGSITAVTGTSGVIERLAYEPFGKRRNTNGTTDPNGTLEPLTDRGFTGHEQMDQVGLINMNGRIFDPSIGRMLSADPLVQAPQHMQSYNRYAYTFNNPLKFTDPSGHACSGEAPCGPDLSASAAPEPVTWNGAWSIAPADTFPFVLSENSYNWSPNTLGFLPAFHVTSMFSDSAGENIMQEGTGVAIKQGMHNFAISLLDGLDTFQRSPVGHALQGLPPEAFAVAGFKFGLLGLARLTKAEEFVALASAGATQTARVGAKGAIETVRVGELIATHGKTMSNKQLDKLIKNIRAEGIQQVLTVTEHQGKLYILDGHHRALAALRAGVADVPIRRVELPFGAYKSPADLTYTPGGY